MKKFLVIYHSKADAKQQMLQSTPEERKKGMEAWMQWAQKASQSLTDMGAPLLNGQSVGVNGATTASDKQVTGYSMLEAEDMEAAKKIIDGHPHISGWSQDATIELHEVMPMSGM